MRNSYVSMNVSRSNVTNVGKNDLKFAILKRYIVSYDCGLCADQLPPKQIGLFSKLVGLFPNLQIREVHRLPLLVGEECGNAESYESAEGEPKRAPLKALGCILASLVLLYGFFKRLYFHPEGAWWPFCGTFANLLLFIYGLHLLVIAQQ